MSCSIDTRDSDPLQTKFLSRNYSADTIEAVKDLDDVLAQLAVSVELSSVHTKPSNHHSQYLLTKKPIVHISHI